MAAFGPPIVAEKTWWGEEGPSTPRGNVGAWGKQFDPWGAAKEQPTYMSDNGNQRGMQMSGWGRNQEQMDSRMGWRTPDPSPLRSNTMTYMGCGPAAGGMTPRRGRGSEEDASRSASPAWPRIRTPSPDDAFFLQQRELTPMMPPRFPLQPQEAMTQCGNGYQQGPWGNMREMPLQMPQEMPRRMPQEMPLLAPKEAPLPYPEPAEGAKTIQLQSFVGQFAAQGQMAHVPPPPPAPMGFVCWPNGAQGAPGAFRMGFRQAAWQPEVQEEGTEASRAKLGERVVSRGSVGHPHCCQEACKYIAKKRGCKDGVNCNRCHLCNWKRHSNPNEGGKSFGQAAPQRA